MSIEWLNFVIDILLNDENNSTWPMFISRKQFVGYLEALFSDLQGVESITIQKSEHTDLLDFFNDQFVPHTSIGIPPKRVTWDDLIFKSFWWLYQAYTVIKPYVADTLEAHIELLEKIFDLSIIHFPILVDQSALCRFTALAFDEIAKRGPVLVELPKKTSLLLLKKLCYHNFLSLNGYDLQNPDVFDCWMKIYLSWICFVESAAS